MLIGDSGCLGQLVNFDEINKEMVMDMMTLSRSRQVGSVQQSFWGGVN